MGNEQGKVPGVPTPAGIQSMDESLQKKFAKGIQYNSKCLSQATGACQAVWLGWWCV